METNSIQQLSDSFRRVIREEITLLLNERFENGLILNQIQPVEIQSRSIIPSKFGWLRGQKSLSRLHELINFYGCMTITLTTMSQKGYCATYYFRIMTKCGVIDK
jgi:hypothetical protein